MTRTLPSEHLRRPAALWWTLLLAVLFVLAPTLGRALAFAGVAGAQRIEICTTQGPQALAPEQAQAAASQGGPESAPMQAHCPFCLHQADRWAPPPPLLPTLLVFQDGPQQLPTWQAFFYSDTTSLWAPPRGPPARTAL